MTTKEEVQELARESANAHFIARHEGDWYAHYYGFIYGYQQAEQKLQQHAVVRPASASVSEGEPLPAEGSDTVAARRLLPTQVYCSECGYVMPKSYFKIHNCAELREGQP